MGISCVTHALAPAARLLPALAAFALAPPASLRAWIAVKALPEPAAIEVKSTRAFKLRKFLHFLVVFSLIFAAEYYFISEAVGGSVNNFITGILVTMIQLSLMGILADWTNAYQWASYRAQSGRTLWRIAPGSASVPKTIGVFAVAGVITAQTVLGAKTAGVLTSSNTFAGLATFALIHRFVAGSHQLKSISIRGVMIALLSWISLSFILSGAVIAVLIKSEQDKDGSFEEGDALEDLTFSPLVTRLTQLLTTALFAAGPGILIAACYRFDYAHHAATEELDYPVPESVERKMCGSRRRRLFARSCESDASAAPTPLPMGTLLPKSSPSGFRRPLYLAAVLSYAVVQLAVSYFFAYSSVIPKELKTDNSVIELVALALTIPSMIIGVVLGACATSRVKAMWTYREQWLVLPNVVEVGKIRLAEEVDVAAVEEAAPAYEDVVGDHKVDSDVKA